MAWFRRSAEESQGTPKRVVIAEGLWIKCESCKEIMYRVEVDKAGRVCPKCHYPFRITARERIALLCDAGSFEESQAGLGSVDPLSFRDTKRYRDRLRAAKQKTAMQEAVVTGLTRIGGYPAMLAVFEFAFLGGSMGSAVGEKLTRSIELAIDKHVPVIIVSASGGARMQEGILSLMQLPKTVCAVDELHEARCAFISVMTHPTTAGVLASFASLGDVIVSEPGALLAFTGPRVVQQTTREKLPDDFGLAESNARFGHVDAIVPRAELRPYVGRLLAMFVRAQ